SVSKVCATRWAIRETPAPGTARPVSRAIIRCPSSDHLEPAAIGALIDPKAYTGLCDQMARDAAVRARAAANEIERSSPQTNAAR
ncbi:MAG: hypothetical protein ACXWCP_29280, partial [Burkholderiales bacterium]